ncbi:MAG TPA: cysteine desulfurase NifS [Lachnospiraceae bacterium]|nr:cysteine desulfurase NifS [Lachnospiraceae bacterium]
MEAYFDNSATTKVYPAVKDIMIKVMEEDYGNPSSLHMKGVEAERYIKKAAESIAKTLRCKPEEIIFTSGGTESNNLALIGTALAKKRLGKHIISTTIEHASVSATLDFLKSQGYEITLIGTDDKGIVNPQKVADAVREDTILVSCMMVNNEIGAIEPVAEISAAVKKKNPAVYMHVDAIQAYGKIPVFPTKTGADLISISGHKIHGPKGSGALYVKKGILIRPIIYGGGQGNGMRSGTENVPAVAGFGVAAEESFRDFDKKTDHIREVRDYLREKLTSLPDVYDNSGDAPHIASFSFVGVRSEVMLHSLEERGIYTSSGSACSSHKRAASNVLTSIGLTKDRLESTLRFSIGEDNTKEQVDYIYDVISGLLPMLRQFTRK